MNIEPKTTVGKILVLLVLTSIAIAPTAIVLISGDATLDFGVATLLVILYLVIFIVVVALSLFGFDVSITKKQQDDVFLEKMDIVLGFLERLRWPAIGLCLLYIGYSVLLRKYGV